MHDDESARGANRGGERAAPRDAVPREPRKEQGDALEALIPGSPREGRPRDGAADEGSPRQGTIREPAEDADRPDDGAGGTR